MPLSIWLQNESKTKAEMLNSTNARLSPSDSILGLAVSRSSAVLVRTVPEPSKAKIACRHSLSGFARQNTKRSTTYATRFSQHFQSWHYLLPTSDICLTPLDGQHTTCRRAHLCPCPEDMLWQDGKGLLKRNECRNESRGLIPKCASSQRTCTAARYFLWVAQFNHRITPYTIFAKNSTVQAARPAFAKREIRKLSPSPASCVCQLLLLLDDASYPGVDIVVHKERWTNRKRQNDTKGSKGQHGNLTLARSSTLIGNNMQERS